MKELYNAISMVQSSAPKMEKDASNPFFKSKYLTLQSVLGTLLPLLKDNGLIVINTTIDCIVTTKIIHCDTGQEVSTSLPMLGANDMQRAGSAITYAQRYNLLSILGLAPGIDDDGNVASSNKEVPSLPPISLITNQQRRTLADLSKMEPLHNEYVNKVIDDKTTTSEKAAAIIDKLTTIIKQKGLK